MNESIRKPQWHHCPAFSHAWDELRSIALDPRTSEEELRGVIGLCREMGTARVIKLHSAQLAPLQQKVDRIEAEGQGMCFDLIEGRAPFPYTFVEVVGGDDFVRGVLISQDHGTVVTPFLWNPQACDWYCGISGRPSSEMAADGRPVVETWAWRRHSGTDDVRLAAGEIMSDAVGVAAAVLVLVNCANIDLAGETLSRQSRRSAASKGEQIALAIRLRRGGRSTGGSGAAIDWSHAWEVGGHFQHHGRGPVYENCKDPKKRITLPDGSEVVRVWVPPYIKGPADKPLVAKVRDARGLAA